MTQSSRPVSLTICSVVLGFLAISALMNAVIWPIALHFFPWQDATTSPRFRHFFETLNSAKWYFSASALLYAATAFWAAVGLWRVRDWAPRALVAWIVAVMLVGIIMLKYTRPYEMERTSEYFAASAGFLVVTLLFLIVFLFYIQSKIRRHQNAI